jgi:RNA polymerase sigma-70 factor (ECF subfamily)
MGDLDGLRELYDGTRQRLVVQLTALTGNRAEAEDCVQDAFAQAAARWKSVAGYDNPEAWVYSVAANAARSRWRRARTALLHVRTSRHEEPTTAGVSADHLELLGALRTLPFEQREAIVLHHVVDLPVDEVAARQGVPVGTVKARLSRGRQALAARLAIETEEVVVGG